MKLPTRFPEDPENLAGLGPDRDLFPIHDVGVAQGCCLSPLIGNMVLHEFDANMNARGITCLRYIDDILVLGRKPSRVKKAFRSALEILGSLGLSAYQPGEASKAEEGEIGGGLDFLGCTIRTGLVQPSSKSRDRLLAKIKDRIDTALHALRVTHEKAERVERKVLIQALSDINHVIEGWSHTYRFCNPASGMRELDHAIDDQLNRLFSEYRQLTRGATPLVRRRLLGVLALQDVRFDPPSW